LAANQVKKAKSSVTPLASEVTPVVGALSSQGTAAPRTRKSRKAAVVVDDVAAMNAPAVPRAALQASVEKAKKSGPKAKAPRATTMELEDVPEMGDAGEDELVAIDGPAEPTAQWLDGSEAALNEEKRRKAVVPSQTAIEGMDLFEYLRTCTPPLDQKIIDIAIAQTQVPLELRADAAQDIRLVWSTMTPDLVKYRPGQIASYAHRMAKHTALRTRREIGSSVRLPGSAFRKRRDGSSYVTPGVLSVALDWNELEGWLDMDAASAEDMVVNMGLGLGEEGALAELGGMVESSSSEESEEEALKHRLEVLEKNKDALTERQYQILLRLSLGETYEEIQAALEIKKGVLMRELNNAAAVIGPV